MNPTRMFASALLLVSAATAVQAQERSGSKDFSWEGRIPRGRWLYVRNLNGGIRVEKSSGDKVEVTGEKRVRRGNPEDGAIGGLGGDFLVFAFDCHALRLGLLLLVFRGQRRFDGVEFFRDGRRLGARRGLGFEAVVDDRHFRRVQLFPHSQVGLKQFYLIDLLDPFRFG